MHVIQNIDRFLRRLDSEAVLIGDTAFAVGGRVFLARVDGKTARDLPAVLVTSMFPYPHGVFVRPGRHQISANYVASKDYPFSPVVEGSLQFDAQPGKTYVLRATATGPSASFWIEEFGAGDAGRQISAR